MNFSWNSTIIMMVIEVSSFKAEHHYFWYFNLKYLIWFFVKLSFSFDIINLWPRIMKWHHWAAFGKNLFNALSISNIPHATHLDSLNLSIFIVYLPQSQSEWSQNCGNWWGWSSFLHREQTHGIMATKRCGNGDRMWEKGYTWNLISWIVWLYSQLYLELT